MYQEMQLIGAGLVLLAYLLLQQGKVRADQLEYCALNLLGYLTLLGVAIAGRQWGFFLLSAAWILITVRSIYRLIFKGRQPGYAVSATTYGTNQGQG